MSIAAPEFAYLAIWNMNGGPVPSDTLEALTEAVQGVLKASEDKNGVRLLHSLITNEPQDAA